MALSPEARAAWRLRREERRAQQRAGNIVRAREMHAARLEYERGLPPAAPAVRNKTASRDPARPAAFVGCSGWYYWHWRGDFYPQDLPTSRWFKHYATRFNTVELNAPFYSWPTVATVESWIRQAGRRRFVYTVKVAS